MNSVLYEDLNMMYNRKTFIKNMAMGAVALGGFPGDILANIRVSKEQESAIRLGIIGYGNMGKSDIKAALTTQMAKVVAVCDVYDKRLEEATAAFGRDILITKAYQEVLASPEVDAVIIATPDHLHLRMAVDALKAKKHVYCEKPVIFDVSQANELITAQKTSGTVFQSGSQGVSSWGNGMAKLIIDSGLIGPVNYVEGQFTVKPNDLKTFVAPEGSDEKSIDWKKFLGDAPQRQFDAQRYFRWRSWQDYTTGLAGDLFVHVLASVHHIMGAEGPNRVYSTGGLRYYLDGYRDTPDVITSLLDYPNIQNKGAFTLSLQANLVDGISKKWASNNFNIIGSKGSMQVEWAKVTVKTLHRIPNELFKGLMTLGIDEPERPANNEYRFNAPRGTWAAHPNHHKNFFDAILAKGETSAGVEFGVKTAAAAILCNQSCVTERPINWDAKNMKIIS